MLNILGLYWSTVINTSDTSHAWYMYFDGSGNVYIDNGYYATRRYGESIRGIQ